MTNELTFLFGAGAEIPLGMPTGGRFALDIISKVYDQHIKERIGSDRDAFGTIDVQNRHDDQLSELELQYRKWMGADLYRKNIEAPGKQELRTVFQSTIENRTQDLVEIAKDVDSIIEHSGGERYALNDIEPQELGIQAGPVLMHYLQPISDSRWLPIIIGYASQLQAADQRAELAWQVVLMFVRLSLAGAGENVAAQVGNIQFHNAQVQQNVGNQLGQLFQVNLNALQPEAFEVAADAAQKEFGREFDPTDISQLFRCILINTVSRIIDYQRLIEHFAPAIYQPSSKWSRFVKAAFLLHRMQKAIDRWYQQAKRHPVIGSYYEDVRERFSQQDIRVATTNYTDLICEITRIPRNDIMWLNGHIQQWLEPYQNTVITNAENDPPQRMLVPYLLAQSVIKPMFTDHTLREYERFMSSIKNSDKVVSVGYGFGQSDSHINTLLRVALSGDEKKHFIVLLHNSDPAITSGAQDSATRARKAVLKRMRLFSDPGQHRLRVGVVDDHRNVSGKPWLDWVQGE